MTKKTSGISTIEVIAVSAISVILVSILVPAFYNLSNSSSLDRDVQSALSLIEKARSMAIDSVDGTIHGVQFASSTVKIFSGATFLSGNVEDAYSIPSKSIISAIHLSNGTTTLYFSKLTGNASATGTVVVSPSSGGAGKTIVIYATGITEIQ